MRPSPPCVTVSGTRETPVPPTFQTQPSSLLKLKLNLALTKDNIRICYKSGLSRQGQSPQFSRRARRSDTPTEPFESKSALQQLPQQLPQQNKSISRSKSSTVPSRLRSQGHATNNVVSTFTVVSIVSWVALASASAELTRLRRNPKTATKETILTVLIHLLWRSILCSPCSTDEQTSVS